MISGRDVTSLLWLGWGVYWVIASRSAAATKRAEGYWSRVFHVAPTAVGFILIFDLFHRTWALGLLYASKEIAAVGVLLVAAGLGFAAWARHHLGRYWSGTITLKEDHRLIRTGPYRIVRHPIYTGFLTGALGSAIAAGTGDAFLGVIVIVVAYVAKIIREEKVLAQEFGADYTLYRQEVPALVPSMGSKPRA